MNEERRELPPAKELAALRKELATMRLIMSVWIAASEEREPGLTDAAIRRLKPKFTANVLPIKRPDLSRVEIAAEALEYFVALAPLVRREKPRRR